MPAVYRTAWGWGTLAALRYGQEIHTRLRFGIQTVHSPIDRNGNGLDDLTDLVRGARAYIRTQPEYVDSYYAGGYPPEGEGVCTDVIWRAFQAAGYDLKAMLDEDVRRDPVAYSIQSIDTNIDFRRVANLRVFFERSGCQALSTDLVDWSQWQPGDIVVFNGHIAIVSDRLETKTAAPSSCTTRATAPSRRTRSTISPSSPTFAGLACPSHSKQTATEHHHEKADRSTTTCYSPPAASRRAARTAEGLLPLRHRSCECLVRKRQNSSYNIKHSFTA